MRASSPLVQSHWESEGMLVPPTPEQLAAADKLRSEQRQFYFAAITVMAVILSLVIHGCAISRLDDRLKELEKQSIPVKEKKREFLSKAGGEKLDSWVSLYGSLRSGYVGASE